MSASSTTSTIVNQTALFYLILALIPLVFFLLFYYYLSQLVGINDSLKSIRLMLEEKWFPEPAEEEKK